MRKRKLQIFLSSTYEDLIDHRLAAMEAILAAGHIPAAMEQFSPGDETAWEKIKAWIGESDAFILILGGRYGSIEPESGKSYVQMEYEYAIERKKPLFALVVSDRHHEERLRQFGIKVDERQRPEKYSAFKATVTQRLCKFWNDQKDIQSAIFQKLPEWAQRDDLVGWVRGDEATNPETVNELARLSRENSELRAKASTETFAGLSFEELIKLLEEVEIAPDESERLLRACGLEGDGEIRNLLNFFERIFRFGSKVSLSISGSLVSDNIRAAHWTISQLAAFGLIEEEQVGSDQDAYRVVRPSEAGQRFRNRLFTSKGLHLRLLPET